jgi:hypothetical protein
VDRIDGSRIVAEEGLAIRKNLEQKFDAAIAEKSASARGNILPPVCNTLQVPPRAEPKQLYQIQNFTGAAYSVQRYGCKVLAAMFCGIELGFSPSILGSPLTLKHLLQQRVSLH